MAEPLTFNEYLGWIDVTDDNNVPTGARIVKAADLIRYETGIDALTTRSNEQDTRLDSHDTTLGAYDTRLDALEGSSGTQGTDLTVLTDRVDDLTQGAAAVQHAPTTALTSAIPSAVTTINAALTAKFKVPDSGRVIVELSQFVRITTAGELRWVIADSATLTTVRTTLAVANNVMESTVTARALITGLTPNADMSWVWRHQIVSPGAGSLQIDATHPALMTVRAA